MGKKKLPPGIEQLKALVAFFEQSMDVNPDDQEVDPDSDLPIDPAAMAPQEAPPPEPEPEDVYAGPSEEDVVGDSRRMEATFLSPDMDQWSVGLGEAWQNSDGELSGTGLLAIMLFEPTAKQRYRSMSIGLDVSPLTILAKRLARGTFLRAKLSEEDND